MKANELRIGNYVYDRGGKVIRIDFLKHLEKNYDCKFGQHQFIGEEEEVHPLTEWTDFAKSIPLTEDWLLKMGFKYDCDLVNSLCKNCIWFNKKNMEATYLLQKLIKINYVHQLQNLYFALTGKELEIKQ